ncbi:hypothetical protein HYW99_03545 [Candidatus Woesearchaeota archaeon]|nr:hypothetical protein [Candidatus Woesearchaeota archaeon]
MAKLKVHPRQSYEEVILDLLNKISKVRKYNKNGRLKKFQLVLFSIIFLALFAGFILNTEVIKGSVVVFKEKNYTQKLQMELSNNSEYFWSLENPGNLMYIKLSGTLEDRGSVKVYIEKNDVRFLILDSSRMNQTVNVHEINGFVIAPNEYSETNVNFINQTNIETSNINHSTVIQTINIALEYKNGTPYDIDNNGIEPINGVIDLTVENTIFGWDLDETKLCTRWDVYSITDEQSTIVCYGSEKCCNFIDLHPKRDSWREPFYAIYGQQGANLENIISAQVIYVDYNLIQDEPFADIYYSKWQNLSANFYYPHIEFRNMCVETCSLNDFNETEYKLIFEINNSVLTIEEIGYSVVEEIKSVTFNLSIVDNMLMNSGTYLMYKNSNLVEGDLIEPDYYELELIPKGSMIDRIKVMDVNITESIKATVGIDNVSNEITLEGMNITKRFAIKLDELEFEEAILMSNASANSLFKCNNWDFHSELCLGTWEKIKDLAINESYQLIINDGVVGFIEGNFKIVTNLTNLSFVDDIPNMTIAMNTNSTLNLKLYFANLDNDTVFDYFKQGNITISFIDNAAIIMPNKDFVGKAYTFISANKSDNFAVSNVFAINIVNITDIENDLSFFTLDPLSQVKLKKYADQNLKPLFKYNTINVIGYQTKNNVVIIYMVVDNKYIRWLTSISNFDDIIR